MEPGSPFLCLLPVNYTVPDHYNLNAEFECSLQIVIAEL